MSDINETGTSKAGTSKAGTNETGTNETGTNETGTNETGTNEDGPRGGLAMRIATVPANTNAAGDIFGGWIMGIMDMAAASTALERSNGRVATVAVSDLEFLRPVHVGDLISCYTEILKIGRTSMTVSVDVWARRTKPIRHERVTKARFVMVALDGSGRPRSVNPA